MATRGGLVSVGANYHRHCVPAYQALDPALNFSAAWVGGLLVATNSIEIGSIGAEGDGDIGFRSTDLELLQEKADLLRRPVREHVVE